MASGKSDWRTACTPIRDQSSCGSCTAFGTIGAWEALNKIFRNETVDLSEQNLFMCSGGGCETGNYMPPVLNRALKGVPTELCCPYLASNSPCTDRCNEWYVDGKRLKTWKQLNGLVDMKNTLDKGPIVATMAVHQSFLSYLSGIYHSLGTWDPVVGYHCICLVGYDDTKGAWLLRNSWGQGWGENGYCWIRYGDSEIEGEAYALELDGEINPDNDGDEPEPSPCLFGNTVADFLNFIPRFFGRKGRFYYLNPN